MRAALNKSETHKGRWDRRRTPYSSTKIVEAYKQRRWFLRSGQEVDISWTNPFMLSLMAV